MTLNFQLNFATMQRLVVVRKRHASYSRCYPWGAKAQTHTKQDFFFFEILKTQVSFEHGLEPVLTQ